MMSLYTRIPLPLIEWNAKNTKYVLTVLPLSGVLIGAAEAVWLAAGRMAGIHAPLYAAVSCGLPLLINGGIHLDGLADTIDARASYASPERRREILHDPRTGAFGAAGIVLYELLTFGVYCELYECPETVDRTAGALPVLMILVFAVPRMLVQIAVCVIPPSAPEGMLYTMSSVSSRPLNLITASGLLLLCMTVAVLQQGWAAVLYVGVAVLLMLYFRCFSIRQFEGLSGDLCGWLLKVSETVLLAAVFVTLRYL